VATVRNPVPDAAALRRAFDGDDALTVGLEEEVMLLDPVTFDLSPRAAEVLDRAGGDPCLKDELPASQLELLSPPFAAVGEAAVALLAARHRLAEAAAGIGWLAGLGVHPYAAPEGELSGAARHRPMVAEYGLIARRQLVFGLHVHVAVRPFDRALGVYNALRSHLPELAALAANAPFYAGADTGLASMRPKLSELLPRQGVPPPFADVGELAAALAWAARARSLTDARQWWWELRLHPVLGTIEVRVCDAQPTVAETAALAAVIHALCAWLAQRHDAGDLPPPAPSWRIEANRWSACRHGLAGTMAGLDDGAPLPTAERIRALLATLGPTAAGLGCETELRVARSMVDGPAPDRHRAVAGERGLDGLLAWLAGRFLLDADG
jgi:glutamate---cysteine ligase / carboxylate-amine ligase